VVVYTSEAQSYKYISAVCGLHYRTSSLSDKYNVTDCVGGQVLDAIFRMLYSR